MLETTNGQVLAGFLIERTAERVVLKDVKSKLFRIPADEIEALEREQSELNALMSGPDYHRRGAQQIRDDRRRSDEIAALLLTKFERWEFLEEARK